ncbi:MAG: YihY/virulence factor BrkB family protein [Acidobacteriota bacterium]|nr:YihY/virulence factor BrkB family protein [Acidobacteriota bacterium]
MVRSCSSLPVLLQQALLRCLDNDGVNLAQSAAYSAIVALFPGLVFVAHVIGRLPGAAPIRGQLTLFFQRVLPGDVSPLVDSYFSAAPHAMRSSQVLLLAALVSLLGASSVIATLMDGIRRANGLAPDYWPLLQRRVRALLLVPLSLVPFALASLMLVFGHLITVWLTVHLVPSVRTSVYVAAVIVRWLVAVTASIGVLGVIYHMGIPVTRSWRRVLPGAVAATLLWFLTTLAFGWYVTRFANYSQVYGSLGAAIALLIWLYLVAFSILWGGEFNTLFCERYL